MVDRLCPKHKCHLVPELIGHNKRFSCPEDGCDIRCWDGHTSTPADSMTRALRKECHQLFDLLWKNGGPMSRSDAYMWLARIMGVSRDKAHIGFLDADQCLGLIDALRNGA